MPNRPSGEAQAFHHCLVDERDRPGRQSRYVAEENMELCEFVFPLQAELVDMFGCACYGSFDLPARELERYLSLDVSCMKVWYNARCVN